MRSAHVSSPYAAWTQPTSARRGGVNLPRIGRMLSATMPPAVKDPWTLKGEAARVFMMADADRDGYLSKRELSLTLRNPQHVEAVFANIDLNCDGRISLREWLNAQKATFDKSVAACKTSLKTAAMQIEHNRDGGAAVLRSANSSPAGVRLPAITSPSGSSSNFVIPSHDVPGSSPRPVDHLADADDHEDAAAASTSLEGSMRRRGTAFGDQLAAQMVDHLDTDSFKRGL